MRPLRPLLCCFSLFFFGGRRAFISELPAEANTEADKGAFELPFHDISSALAPIEEEDLVEVTGQRLRFNQFRAEFSAAIFDIDEPIQCFDRDGHRKVQDKQRITHTALAERAEIFRQPKAAALGGRRCASWSGARANTFAQPRRQRWRPLVSQQDARLRIPGCVSRLGEGSRSWFGAGTTRPPAASRPHGTGQVANKPRRVPSCNDCGARTLSSRGFQNRKPVWVCSRRVGFQLLSQPLRHLVLIVVVQRCMGGPCAQGAAASHIVIRR